MSESRTDTVVAWGDSQTAGFSWGNRLPLLSETITEAIGRGISGQEAGSVAVRQGGIVLTTTADVTVPASTEPVVFPVKASVTPCNIRSTSSAAAMILGGVRGTITALASADVPEGMPQSSRATGVFTMKFVPAVAPSAPVSVPSGSDLVSQDVADHPEWAECLTIIWAGGNDAAFAGSTRVTGVVSAARAMVDRLKAAVDEPKFLVASRTVYNTEVEGTAGYETALAQRDALAAEFPDNAIDIWGYVRDHGLDILGITPTEADLTAKAGGAIPPSLTAPDNIHYTTETREQVLAPFIIKELADRGWTVPKKEVPPVADYTPTHWENAPSKKTPVSAENLNNIETGIQSAKEASAAAAQGVADLRETKADAATVTTALAGKVDALPETQKNKLYGTGADGKFYTYGYSATAATPNTVVARTGGGGVVVGEPATDVQATTKKYVDTKLAALPAAPPTGTRAMLDEGTDTTPRLFAAKDIADYVAAKIAELAQPKA